MKIFKLRNLEKSHFSKRLKNNKTDNTQTQKEEPKESFAEVLKREQERLEEK